ncbi:MAG: hypothetical protein ICV87_13740, partial [Gemmatimonadetes bacterium]|nr:hypothetical protein [Gemmatimonadota bacterium]
MPRIIFLLAALLLGGGHTLAAQTARGDTAAVVAVAQALLNTLATRDTAAAGALLGPGFTLVATRSDTASGARAQDRASFLRTLTEGSERLLERMWSPVVHVQGPLAVVWTPYDFHVDGQFSHCGID